MRLLKNIYEHTLTLVCDDLQKLHWPITTGRAPCLCTHDGVLHKHIEHVASQACGGCHTLSPLPITSLLRPPYVVSLFSSFFLFSFLSFCVPSVVFVCGRSLSSVSQKPSPHRGNYAGICETICYDFSGCAHLYLQR